jgi:NADPH:quinone reductase
MSKMRAAIYERFGPAAEVLRVVEIEQPEPGPGEVRVRVRVSAVNPTDWKSRNAGKGELPFPFLVPNQDGAGEIDAVGEGVSAERVGERVWIYFAAYKRQYGTAAQWVCLPQEQAVALPAAASFDLGASLGIPALTAHRCLFADGPLDGLTVLVAGGAGAVAHYAIQLARRAGARVISTVSSDEKAALARAAGANETVNYREGDAAEAILALAPGGVDRVVEVAPSENTMLDVAVTAPYASVISYASGDDMVVPVRPLMTKNVNLRFMLIYEIPRDALRLAVDEVSAALADGDLSELTPHRFSLDDIAAAHDAVASNAVGKVLVDVD